MVSSGGGRKKGKASGGEVQISKSPAEFFAENQAIAGFDNMGKSLYTTIRELVENSLDACESVHILPDIEVQIEELTQPEFNVLRGLTSPTKKKVGSGEQVTPSFSTGVKQKDVGLFSKGKKLKASDKGKADSSDLGSNTAADGGSNEKKGKKDNKKKKPSTEAYFRIKVRDNGCGMSHDAIPNLLGRVLSGSKYGVRQTRGKFGLGAKMALIWSKKSTGVPITITTAHMPNAQSEPAEFVSTCVLDIDIYKNEPRIIEHKKRRNTEKWIGTEFEVLIAGNWTTYKSRIVQYLQQLAIITPYAKLEMHYANKSDNKRNMTIRYDRRSEQMPQPAREVKHHPSSVNNLLVQQLLERTRTKTFLKFLTSDLSSVSPALGKRLIAELGNGFEEGMSPGDLSDKQVTRLVQLLRSVELFKAPDGSCLSPLGEYNLNLGIRKVLEPTIIATARDKPGAYEGHPFIVEAAVSVGGKEVKEGITVVRFANRIPLLFEGGADVATRVATSKIRWSNYKIDHKRDKIGVFVSIVSTKVPFKGTGKEYIGDDITEIQQSVKRALQSCCQQLRAHLTKRNALKDIKERKSRLIKYIPDIGRSLHAMLENMKKRRLEQEDEIPATPSTGSPRKKRMRFDEAATKRIMDKFDQEEITEESIKKSLLEAVEAQADAMEGGGEGNASNSRDKKEGGASDTAVPLFIRPVLKMPDRKHDVHHPLFVFRPINPIAF